MAIQYLYSISAGFLISLSGSLPLGNLNLTAMNIAAGETLKRALWFALGVSLVEVIYLAITLHGISWILSHSRLLYYIQWLNISLLLILAAGCFLPGVKKQGRERNILIMNKPNRFLLGLTMSAVNPVQIPFWAGWTTYLLTQYSIKPNTASYNLFAMAAGVGTLLALLIFIFAGRRFSALIVANQGKANVIMGLIFIIIAVVQLIKLLN